MSNIITSSKKNYWSLDVAKLICALTIISAHFAAERGHFPTLIDYCFSVYVVAVPFFFCCSGFLFFKKMDSLHTKEAKKEYFIKYQKRLWIMYGIWTLVYLPFQMYDWAVNCDFVEEVIKFVHRSLVIQTYSTIWFLPALAVGIAATYFLVNKFSKKTVFIIAALLYVFGMFGYTYLFVFEGTPIGTFYDWYLTVFKTTRNGIFNAIPYIFMGYLISHKQISPSKKNLLKYATAAVISLVFLVAESFILKMKFNVSGMDIGIFVVPFTYFFVIAALHVELKARKLWLWCRKLSLGVFLSQRVFLSCMPIVFPDVCELLYESNSYIGLILVVSATIALSVVIVQASKRFKFFSYFM